MNTEARTQTESGNNTKTDTEDTFGILAPLNDVHKSWLVRPRRISGQVVIDFIREDFHTNGSPAEGVAIDHPKKDGWHVLAPGDSRTRWEATYENSVAAAVVVSELTHLFESRRAIKHQRPAKWKILAHYAIEDLLLDALKRYEVSDPQSQDPPTPYQQ